MERNAFSDKFPLGSKLPSFSLPATDGKSYGDNYLQRGKLGLVVFSCNHCPYVKGSERFLNEVVRAYAEEGLKTVVINSNDASQYPEDSFEKMREKACMENLPYPYLYDETQEVAKMFDAACTPECYLFNKEGILIYHGTVAGNVKDASAAMENHLENAVKQALKGLEPKPSFVHPVGCSIKWKRE